MITRRPALLAAGVALTLYAGGLAAAWMVAQSVPRAERDGMEWMYVFLLTMPWSLFVGIGGWLIVHVGAVVNGGLIALVAAGQRHAAGRKVADPRGQPPRGPCRPQRAAYLVEDDRQG